MTRACIDKESTRQRSETVYNRKVVADDFRQSKRLIVLAEWREGWSAVAAAAVGYGTGGAMVMMTAGLFIKPMRESLGWSTSAVTITPIIALVLAISSPLAGFAVDRLGSRRVAIFGTTALMLCMLAVAFMPINRPVLYCLAALMGLCGALTQIAPYAKGVASWFREGLGGAFGMTLNGVAIVSLLAIPVTSAAIFSHGWRAGYLALAGIILCLGLPAIILGFRERALPAISPGAIDQSHGMTVRVATRDIRFWILAASFMVGSFALGGYLAHLQPLLASRGFGIAQATSLGVVYAIASSIGRIGGGILLDRIWDHAVAAILLGLAAFGGYLLGDIDVRSSTFLVGSAVFLVGMAQGAESDFIAYFTLRIFGIRTYSTLLGFMAMLSAIGLALGAFTFALLFDIFQNYQLACYFGSGGYMVSGLLIFIVAIVSRNRNLPSITVAY